MNLTENNSALRVCIVQPVQSPYWSERLKELAKHNKLEIVLLLERDSFAHRPGWQMEQIPEVKTIILSSHVMNVHVNQKDLGYQGDGVRTIPVQLSKVIIKLKPDVVLVCNATQLLLALPAQLILGFHLALIVEDTPHSTRNLPWHKLLIKKWLYRRSDSWLPFSDDAEVFLQKIGIRHNIYRSCWSIDTERFSPLDSHISEEGRLTICVIGALIERKGIMPLLEAWKSIPKETRNYFQLKIAGTGPLSQLIKTYLSTNQLHDVQLMGQLPYDAVIKLLKESSLSVLPTLEDLCSLTVPEAMACGCPVITTPYNGARDLIEHGVNGWIADPAKPGDLALWLTHAMSDIERLQQMGKAARERALSRDNKQVMQQFANQLLAMGNER